MRKLSIDIETYSSYDLADVGVHKYVEAPDFEILLLAYSADGGPVEVVDFASGQQLPTEIAAALYDPTVTLHAFNAAFERTCINKFLMCNGEGPGDPARWYCTMVHAAYVGLPLSLGTVAEVIGLEQQKDTEGKRLIAYFCVPCKATKTNGGRTRNLPEHDPWRWPKFVEYCRQDVVVEQAIQQWVSFYEIPAFERNLYVLDQLMNDRGVHLDLDLVRGAIGTDEGHVARLMAEARELTGLENPTSNVQLTDWLWKRGRVVPDLKKETVESLLHKMQGKRILQTNVIRVLQIRQSLSKTSVSKYHKMLESVCLDGRYRGLVQFYGANRTGRDAGRGVQLQNLPQIKLKELDLPRAILKKQDYDTLAFLYDGQPEGRSNPKMYADIPNLLSQLIRTAIVAKEGYEFIVSDFKSIEARVIAHLAREEWALEAFATHGLIYEATASKMFGIPIEEILKDSPERQKGKIGTLALGYQGGVNALITMGALNSGLREDELQPLVTAWRKANSKIVKYWYDIQDAAIQAVEEGVKTRVRDIRFFVEKDILFIELPSGRRLSYVRPRVAPGKFDKMALSYEGMDQEKKIWRRMDTYGGKLVENIVQAFARDVMMVAFTRLTEAGYNVVMRVHDELVIEAPENTVEVEEIDKIMAQPIEWATGLPLGAEGFKSKHYKK